MTTETTTFLVTALKYANLGWPIVPLHSPRPDGSCSCQGGGNCTSPGKHPRIVTGKNHDHASIDPELIQEWWRKWPNANVGVITGERSGIVLVDVDPRNHGDMGSQDEDSCRSVDPARWPPIGWLPSATNRTPDQHVRSRCSCGRARR